MKKILIPTDFSEPAEYALSLAQELAQKADAELHLIHVVMMPHNERVEVTPKGTFADGILEDYTREFLEKSHQYLKKIVDGLKLPAGKVHYQISSGHPHQVMLAYINKHNIDLVVMGTQGAGNSPMIGSNAQKMVRIATCPVLTLRQPVRLSDIKTITFACDLDEEQSLEGIGALKKLQQITEAELQILFVNTPTYFNTSRQIQDKLTYFVQKHQIKGYSFALYQELNEERGILSFLEEQPEQSSQMLALSTHQRSGLSFWLAGSVTEAVVNTVGMPVFTFQF
ncbi:universal stress protein [Eisenibacter elegans]|uniref:universal stress protein n=1 Tax=Eisenibacter elegans TaxID=997 RepID=UPI0004167B3D|nr:universal stress protein [Eisenibacter elegans]